MSAATAAWSNFFVAEVGASAALTLKYRWLPQRAAQTLVVLGEALLLASVCLMPRQPALVVGIELLATVVLAAVILLLLSGHPAGLYCIAFGILLALVLGVFNAWIFLVEIVR